VNVSGGGQINNARLDDQQVVVTTVAFRDATVHAIVRDGATVAASGALGAEMGTAMATVPGLRHVLLFAEGLTFNAVAFLESLNASLPASVRVSGGLASNGLALSRTVLGLNAEPAPGRVIAIGLAGESLVIGTGSDGGWSAFGPERVVTAAGQAVVQEIDGEPALEVYKRYLGTYTAELPGSALLFPLAVRATTDSPVAVRTILGVDEATGAMQFAGDIPLGSTVQLMHTTTDQLVEGAARAARMASADGDVDPQLTLCVSCIGRRAVMRSRVEEELEEVVHASRGAAVVGLYSNGEVAPPADGREHARSVLHNQTMTITTIGER
jgi:hypothetical protein